MYWPNGLPRIYAASSSSKAQQGRIFESEDDAESRETTEGNSSQRGDASTTSESTHEEPDFQLPLLTPATPLTPAIKRVDSDPHRLDSPNVYNGNDNVFDRSFGRTDKEPILALRISRTGHLFATITSTTLTIWQTKVCSALATYLALLSNCLKAYCNFSRCYTLPLLPKYLRLEYLLARSPRLCNICCPNFTRLPGDLFSGL